MLKLTLAQEPRWLDLPHGVRVEVEPLTTARAQAARHEAIRRAAAVRAEAEDAAKAGMPRDATAFSGANHYALAGMAQQFEIEALGRYGIRRWEGLAGPDGAPLPVDPASIEAFAAHPDLGPAFLEAYLRPLEEIAAEGEGSAPSANGDSAGGASTATDAQDGPQGQTESPAGSAASALG